MGDVGEYRELHGAIFDDAREWLSDKAQVPKTTSALLGMLDAVNDTPVDQARKVGAYIEDAYNGGQGDLPEPLVRSLGRSSLPLELSQDIIECHAPLLDAYFQN